MHTDEVGGGRHPRPTIPFPPSLSVSSLPRCWPRLGFGVWSLFLPCPCVRGWGVRRRTFGRPKGDRRRVSERLSNSRVLAKADALKGEFSFAVFKCFGLFLSNGP